MAVHSSKVAIIGNGFVGATTAYCMALTGLVGEMVLIDVVKEKSFGEALDIVHAVPFTSNMTIYSGDYADVKDCDVIVITAGANRKPGETRLDLAKKNTSILKGITENVMKHYNGGVVLMVANPVDVLTYMFQKWSGLPSNLVVGSGTALDSARLRCELSSRLKVDAKDIHSHIIGEHGDSQVPLWSTANIMGTNLDEYCRINNISGDVFNKEQIALEVKQSGATIIKNKGATYYGIGTSVNRIVEAIIRNQSSVMTVGSVINGAYGLNDVAFSLPSVVNKNGIDRIVNIDLSAEETAALQASATAVKAIIDEVKDI